jgi:putative aldouronate transport system permease protein
MRTTTLVPPEPIMRTGYHRQQRMMRLSIHMVMIFVAFLMILPFWLIISVSLTDSTALSISGYNLIPSEFSAAAYEYLFKVPHQLVKAYGVTVFVTFFGTTFGLTMMSMLAYGMSRLVGRTRKVATFYVLFTVLFSGGVIPFYLVMTQIYGLKDTMMALIFPYLIGPFYVLLLRSYFVQLPHEILEAAKIDGANEWRIFYQMVLPLSTPALATIGLFLALNYWNDYWMSLLFISRSDNIPLQYLLYNMLNNVEMLTRSPEAAALTSGILPPVEPLRMAMAVVAAGPAVIFSLVLGRYFVRGITLGALNK